MASVPSTGFQSGSVVSDHNEEVDPDLHHAKRRRIWQEFGLMRPGIDHGKNRFVGSSSGVHFVRTVYATLAQKSKTVRTPSAEQSVPTDLVPGEDDQLEQQTADDADIASGSISLPKPATFWSLDEIIATDQDDGAPSISFEDLVQWTQSYFDNWHPFLPFLNAPRILGYFEKVANDGIASLPDNQAAVVRALVSISLADARQSIGTTCRVPRCLLFKDRKDVASCTTFAFSQVSSLENLQGLMAIQLYLVSSLMFNYASRLGGLVLRMVFQLGLHRCPTRYTNFTAPECLTRQRVFWSAYCLERMLSQSLGLPLDIHDEDIDTCYPGEEIHGQAQKEDKSAGTTLRLLVMSAKHARIRGLILELRNKSLPARNDTLDRSIAVHAELSKWINETQDLIDSFGVSPARGHNNDFASGPSFTSIQRLFMKMLQHESEITLNRPGMTAHAGTSAGLAALQNCITAARSIITLLDDFRTAHQVSSNDSKMDCPLVWPMLTWSTWMSCFILAYAALEGHSSLASARSHAMKAEKVLQHLSLRRSRWPESCGAAVEHLIVALSEKSDSLWKASQPPHPLTTGPPKPAESSRLANQAATTRSHSHHSLGGQASDGHIEDRSLQAPLRDTLTDAPSTAQTSSSSSTVDRPIENKAIDSESVVAPNLNESIPLLWSPTSFDMTSFDPFDAIDFSNFLSTDQDTIGSLYNVP